MIFSKYARKGVNERESSASSGTFFLFIDENLKISTINSISIDPLGLTINLKSYSAKPGGLEVDGHRMAISVFPNVTGLYGHVKIEASDLITVINHVLKGNKLTIDQRRQLEDLAPTLEEDGNPVLIIGKVK
jgi:hypothetical protein